MAKKSNHPGSSGLAQSGGINHSFGGGKGGTKNSKGVTAGRKIGGGTNIAGLRYTTRTEGGNNTLVRKGYSVGAPPPLNPPGDIQNAKVRIHRPSRGGAA